MKPFKELLNEKETVYGVFAKTNDPYFIRALGKSGFDFVILDNEHGPNSVRDTYPLIMTSFATGMYPIVRVGKLIDIMIQRILDLGPAGVQIPQIQCKEDAENVRKFTKFHPKGKRGVCRFVSAADCGLMDKSVYFSEKSEAAVVIHIEGKEGIDQFDEIVKVEDINVIFIGPYDLSQSLGVPGQVDNPTVTAEIKKLIERCKEHNKYIGTFADDVETAKRYRDLGVKYIGISVDVGIFAEACLKMVEQLKS